MIEFLCTLAGMIAGGAIVASIVGLWDQHKQEDFLHQIENINAEKIRGITTQLQALSERVLDNVCTHTEKIRSYGNELIDPDTVNPDIILDAVDKIISANQQMQNELETAQRQLILQQEIIEQTTMQAKSDSLTGLANRRALDEHIRTMLESKKQDEQLGLLLMDIDHFKRFNDTYGHLTGDAVLTSFARLVQQSVRADAFVARYGGEEFVVLLRGSSEKALVEQAAQVRKFVSEQTISYEDLELNITASAGLCMLRPGDNLSIAYERADEGMYKAKELGRNRGMWQSNEGWLQFPDNVSAVEKPAEAKVNSNQSVKANETFGNNKIEETTITKSALTETRRDADNGSEDSRLNDGESVPAYLDLATFVEKIRDHLSQLRQMDLPAACIMVEAIIPGEEPEMRRSWQKVLELVQTKARGIDILCFFRPFTVCLFLPGCSADVSYERAAEIKQILLRAAINWDLTAIPEKFNVVASQIFDNEEVANMLNRIESALDESIGARDEEIAIHDGTNTQFF